MHLLLRDYYILYDLSIGESFAGGLLLSTGDKVWQSFKEKVGLYQQLGLNISEGSTSNLVRTFGVHRGTLVKISQDHHFPWYSLEVK